jgi:hypothetical protein
MKTMRMVFAALCFVFVPFVVAFGQTTYWIEGFESGAPDNNTIPTQSTSAPAVETAYTSTAGTWGVFKGYLSGSAWTTGGGTKGIDLLKSSNTIGGAGTLSYIITPSLASGVGTVAFNNPAAAPSAKDVLLEKSTDNGATWVSVSVQTTGAVADALVSWTVNDPAANKIKITNTSNSDLKFDNLTVTSAGGTGVSDNVTLKPGTFSLAQNYPNPFNPVTQISYNIPKESYVSLKVYNLMGQEVATLVSGNQTAGKYTIPFDASRLSSGIYMYRLQAGSSVEVKRMMFVK